MNLTAPQPKPCECKTHCLRGIHHGLRNPPMPGIICRQDAADAAAARAEAIRRVQAGEWVQPRRNGYIMQCCGCGLKHRLDFRLLWRGLGRVIQFRAFRMDGQQPPTKVEGT